MMKQWAKDQLNWIRVPAHGTEHDPENRNKMGAKDDEDKKVCDDDDDDDDDDTCMMSITTMILKGNVCLKRGYQYTWDTSNVLLLHVLL